MAAWSLSMQQQSRQPRRRSRSDTASPDFWAGSLMVFLTVHAGWGWGLLSESFRFKKPDRASVAALQLKTFSGLR